MISPNTPSGTEIVCVNDDAGIFNKPGAKYAKGGLNGLKKGMVYTVQDIIVLDYYPHEGELSVRLVEIRRPCGTGFHLSRFRYLSRFATESEYKLTAPVDKERVS